MGLFCRCLLSPEAWEVPSSARSSSLRSGTPNPARHAVLRKKDYDYDYEQQEED